MPMADILTAVQLIIKYSRNKRGKSGATAKVSNCKILKQPSTQHVQSAIFEHPPNPPQKKENFTWVRTFLTPCQRYFLTFYWTQFPRPPFKTCSTVAFHICNDKAKTTSSNIQWKIKFSTLFLSLCVFFLQCRHARQAGNVQYSDSTTGMDGWMDEDDDVDSIYMCVYLYIRGF